MSAVTESNKVSEEQAINKQIAETILSQMGGHKLLALMINAKKFLFEKKNLTFRFFRSEKNKANYVDIQLMPSDTYKLDFWSIHGSKCKIVETIEDVYADDLMKIFSDSTGHTLAVPRIFRNPNPSR